jgi:hypothetical protein
VKERVRDGTGRGNGSAGDDWCAFTKESGCGEKQVCLEYAGM